MSSDFQRIYLQQIRYPHNSTAIGCSTSNHPSSDLMSPLLALFPLCLFSPELLLVTWGLCFIASRAESPTQKGRDFTQPIQIGKEIVSRKRRRSSTAPETFELEDRVDENSYWKTAGRGRPEPPSGGSITAIPPVSEPPAGDGRFSKPMNTYTTASIWSITLICMRRFITWKSGGGAIQYTLRDIQARPRQIVPDG